MVEKGVFFFVQNLLKGSIFQTCKPRCTRWSGAGAGDYIDKDVVGWTGAGVTTPYILSCLCLSKGSLRAPGATWSFIDSISMQGTWLHGQQGKCQLWVNRIINWGVVWSPWSLNLRDTFRHSPPTAVTSVLTAMTHPSKNWLAPCCSLTVSHTGLATSRNSGEYL